MMGLHVTGTTSTAVSLAWDDLATEKGYYVKHSTDGIRWTGTLFFADATSHTVTGLVSGTTYMFRLTGFDNGPMLGERGEVVTARPA